MATIKGNEVSVRYSANSTDWKVIATDDSGYDTLGALVADGKTAFPGLDPGQFLSSLEIVTDNGSGAAGAGCYYSINDDDAPTTGMYVASGIKEVDGVKADGSSQRQIRCVWVKKVTGTNGITLHGIY